MKCEKCGYDYPANALRCPACGTENKIGKAWQAKENEARDDMLRTKNRIIRSMPMYVADKVMNIILLLAAVAIVLVFFVVYVVSWTDEKFSARRQASASVEYAEELYQAQSTEELDAYLDQYELYDMEEFDKYTEYVSLCNQYNIFLPWVLTIQERTDWNSGYQVKAYLVRTVLDYAKDILTEDHWAYRDLEFEENREYLESLKEEAAAILLGTLGMTPDEITELSKADYGDWEPLVKEICERKGWEYEEE